MAIEHERARTQHVKETAKHQASAQAQRGEVVVEKMRYRVRVVEQEIERVRVMGRSAAQQEVFQTVVQQQAIAIVDGGRAVVVSLQQSAQETIHASEMRVVQSASFALQAGQQQSANTELELQHGWYQREITVRQKYHEKNEIE
jgi:hypothetical protein